LQTTCFDDFGLKPLRPPQDEDFHDLIAERYERTATILTSNLDFGEWGDAFAANKMLGAAVQLALDIGITAAQDWCANQVHVARRTWQSWEYGDRAMPPGLWELLLI
jgi:hypothetical protein